MAYGESNGHVTDDFNTLKAKYVENSNNR